MNMPSSSSTATILAVGALMLFGIVIVLLFFKVVPSENSTSMSLAIGALISIATGAFGFYFGSSTSSKDKDATIATIATNAGTGAGDTNVEKQVNVTT